MVESELNDLLTKCFNHIPSFLKFFFPSHFSKDFSPFHVEIFNLLKSNNRLAIAAPRRHGKSAVITFGWVMWKLLIYNRFVPENEENHFTILIGNNYNNALKFLTPIKEELEHNPRILSIFGPLKSDKWSENEIELTSKQKIVIGGNDFKIRGQKYLQYRPDLVVIDDAEDDELVRNELRRKDFEHWFLYGVEPAMSQDLSQIVMVGTIIHRDSQLSKVSDCSGKYQGWNYKKYEALTENGALWDDGVPQKWLEEEKSKNPHVFSQEYQNNPVPYEHAMFKPEYFDDYTKDALPRELIINITVDLACTDKTYSDFTVIMPCGVDSLGDLWVLPYERVKYADPDKILDSMFNLYLRYAESGVTGWKFGKFGIEKVGFQRFLVKNFIKERKKRKLHFAIEEIDAKGDKISRIARLQPWFAGGDIHIRADMLDLKEELLDFPRARHDDITDALAYHIDLVSQKPIVRDTPDDEGKVTPERQRNRILNRNRNNLYPKVYCNY